MFAGQDNIGDMISQVPGAKLHYREFTIADVHDVHAYCSDPQVVQWSTWGPNTFDQTAAFIEDTVRTRGVKDRVAYSLAATLDGTVIGSVAVWTTDTDDRNGELGYTFHRSYWGNGYATEAVRQLLELGFGQLQLERIAATCHPDNIGSIRVLEKSGFQFEGRLRSHKLVRGARRDSLLYAVVRDT